VLQELKIENLTVREREVVCSPVIRKFKFEFLIVGNPYCNGRRERISSSEAMIYQWKSLELCLMVKKDKVPRPFTTEVSSFATHNRTQGQASSHYGEFPVVERHYRVRIQASHTCFPCNAIRAEDVRRRVARCG
jgi:hypothetical protein